VGDGIQGEAGSSGRRIAAWSLAAVSPLIAWLVVKAAAMGMSTATAVAMAPLPPAHPGPTLKVLGALVQQPGLPVTGEVQQSARDGLEILPLAFEPFFVAARAAEQKRDLPRAIALLEEARRRRPTYPAVRMQLAAYYTNAKRYNEALSEIDVILRRNEELRPALLPELTKLIADPRGRQALSVILAGNPPWRDEFFAVAGTRKVAPAHARDLLQRIRALKPNGNLRLENQLVLQSQSATGDYSGARQTWLAALPESERAGSRFVFDGAFRGVQAPKPFSWQFHDAEAGRAEPAKDGQRTYLDVAYFGGRALILAEQTLALAPGRYTISAIARSPNGITSGQLFWRLNCQPGGAQIGMLDLSRAASNDRRFTAAFTVPASGCAGQTLALAAEPGDVATVANLEIPRVEIGR
jgi:tetratricopeptide (TPR) repeat protein